MISRNRRNRTPAYNSRDFKNLDRFAAISLAVFGLAGAIAIPLQAKASKKGIILDRSLPTAVIYGKRHRVDLSLAKASVNSYQVEGEWVSSIQLESAGQKLTLLDNLDFAEAERGALALNEFLTA